MARHAFGYGAYLYTEKDPGIYLIKTALRDKLGGLSKEHLAIVEQNGGPVVQTLDNWFNGDTKKPRNESLEACGRAAGMHRVWQDLPREEYEKVLRQAARIQRLKEQAREKAQRKAQKKRARKPNGR